MQLSKVTYALVAAGLIGGVATFYHQVTPSPVAEAFAATTPPAVATQAVMPTAAANLPDFTALVDRVGPAVVNISVIHSGKKGAPNADADDDDDDAAQDPYREFFKRFGGGQGGPRMAPQQPSQGMGSGFIVSPDGFIVTNAHVVDGASEVTVKLTDRREFTAKVLGSDKRTDIALIKIEARNLPALEIANAPDVRRGEWVIAIGAPFGFENSVSAGVVSGVHRALPNGQMVPFIQTDVAVNPGNSGGPLLNSKGQVVGVNSQIYSRSGGYQGVSFAIPIELASHIKDQIVAHGKVEHARLGVTVQPVNQAFADSFKLPRPEGALVAQVEKGSAADQAGLKAGDVILRADGQAIVDSGDLPARIALARPGDKLPLEVWRNGRAEQLTATLQGAKGKAETVARADGAAHGKLGLALRPLQPDEKRQAQVDGGLRVEQAGGAAAAAGVQAGDVLLSINGQPATSVEQVRGVVAKADKSVALLIERGGQQLFVPVPLA